MNPLTGPEGSAPESGTVVPPALLHWVEEAIEHHGAALEAAFPACFDWRSLCADAPALVTAVDAAALDLDESERTARCVQEAENVLRLAYVGTLAVLAVRAGAAVDLADPAAALTELEQISDEAEAEFEELVADVLEPMELVLTGQTKPPHRGPGARAWALIQLSAAALEQLVERAGLPEQPVGQEAGRKVLWGIARLGLVLATLRWMVREEFA